MKKNILLLLLTFFVFIECSYSQDKPQYQIVTHRGGIYLGTFNIELFPLIAPLHTRNFDSLVSVQAFDSTAFHRVVPGFVIQGGDPNSISGPVSTWGFGNPNQPTVNAEFSAVHHYRGRLGAARDANINSATSQFYICVASATGLDGQYTMYGQVINGMDIVDTIVNSPTVPGTERPVQKIEMFITYTGVNDSVPDPPSLVSPANNALGVSLSASFQWTAVNSAVMYTAEISNDSLFSAILISKDAGGNSSTLPGLQPSTQYYWRVKSNNGGYESVYSNVYSFRTVAAPPVLYAPHDTATNVALNPVFSWNDVEPLSTYILQVSNSSVFTVPSMVYNQSGLTDTVQQVTGLSPNTMYWWRVRSTVGQPGIYSPKYSFTTINPLGISDNHNLTLNNIYPNPAHDKFTVDVFLNNPGDVEISLVNDAGTRIYHRTHKVATRNFLTTIDVNKFSKGIYFLSVKANGEEIVRKVNIE